MVLVGREIVGTDAIAVEADIVLVCLDVCNLFGLVVLFPAPERDMLLVDAIPVLADGLPTILAQGGEQRTINFSKRGLEGLVDMAVTRDEIPLLLALLVATIPLVEKQRRVAIVIPGHCAALLLLLAVAALLLLLLAVAALLLLLAVAALLLLLLLLLLLTARILSLLVRGQRDDVRDRCPILTTVDHLPDVLDLIRDVRRCVVEFREIDGGKIIVAYLLEGLVPVGGCDEHACEAFIHLDQPERKVEQLLIGTMLEPIDSLAIDQEDEQLLSIQDEEGFLALVGVHKKSLPHRNHICKE